MFWHIRHTLLSFGLSCNSLLPIFIPPVLNILQAVSSPVQMCAAVFFLFRLYRYCIAYSFFRSQRAVTERWTQPTPSPENRGWLENKVRVGCSFAFFGCGHLSMFCRNCQTFRPIVRPLLSALTKLDQTVAVAPENPNLSTWIRSGG